MATALPTQPGGTPGSRGISCQVIPFGVSSQADLAPAARPPRPYLQEGGGRSGIRPGQDVTQDPCFPEAVHVMGTQEGLSASPW